jgi:Spy/CpxP family protein refolding chaperone
MDFLDKSPPIKGEVSMMKRSVRFACIVCAVLFLAASFAQGAVKKKKADDPMIKKWWERPKIIQKLGLTEQQVSSVKEIYNERYNQIVEERWHYRQQKSNLEDLLRKTDLDDDQINKQTEVVKAARAALEKTLTEMQTTMMKELTPEQRRDLLTILKNWKEETHQKKKRQKNKERRAQTGR